MEQKISLLLSLLISLPWVNPLDIGTCQICLSPSTSIQLLQVNMLYRHGDRNPISEYPKSKYPNETDWEEGYGQLTKTGMKQHYEFGEWIMKHYGPEGCGLIPAEYNLRDYKVVTTNLDRTMMSAMSNTAGMYRPKNYLVDGLKWTPVPIRNIQENEYDEIFGQFCPKMTEILTKLRIDRFKELQRQNPQLFAYAEEHSGYGIQEHPERMYWLYDTVFVESVQKNWVPEKLQPIFPNPLRSFFYEFLKQYVWTDELKRFNAGPTLKTIYRRMINKTLGLDTVKLHVYSAHDTNVFSILSVFGLEPDEPPRYTSAVIFELYKAESGSHFVRLLYRPGPSTVPYPLIMPGCGGCEYCHLDSFRKVVEPYFPKNLREECKTNTPDFAEEAQDREAFLERLVRPYLR